MKIADMRAAAGCRQGKMRGQKKDGSSNNPDSSVIRGVLTPPYRFQTCLLPMDGI